MNVFVCSVALPQFKSNCCTMPEKMVWVKVADLEGKLTTATKAKGLCIAMKHNLYTLLVASLSQLGNKKKKRKGKAWQPFKTAGKTFKYSEPNMATHFSCFVTQVTQVQLLKNKQSENACFLFGIIKLPSGIAHQKRKKKASTRHTIYGVMNKPHEGQHCPIQHNGSCQNLLETFPTLFL